MMRLSERIGSTTSRPWASVLVVAAAYLLYLCLKLSSGGWDASAFIEAGDHYVNPDKTVESIDVAVGSDGYDGQFYYRLALDPSSRAHERYGVTLDKPSYRQQRILYPLIVRGLSLGNPGWVPEALIAVNLVAILVCAYLGAAMAKGPWRSLHGVAIALYPGFLLSFSRDLAEPVAIALVLGSLFALKRKRPIIATGLLALAVLTRETTLVVVLAAGLVWVWEKIQQRRKKPTYDGVPWYYPMAPASIWIAWQSVFYFGTGTLAVASGGNNLTFPFIGIVDAIEKVRFQDPRMQLRWLLGIGLVTLTGVVALAFMGRSSASRTERTALWICAVLVAMLSGVVWIEDWAFLRATSEMFLIAFIVLSTVPSKLTRSVLAASIGVWLALASINV